MAADVMVDVAAVNDAPVVTGAVALAAIAESSGARLITQAQLLGNATDPDGPPLTATGLTIATGAGTLVDNNDGTWSYTPALNDDTSVSFSYLCDRWRCGAGRRQRHARHHAGERCA